MKDNCPKCNASYFQENGPSMTTLAYYPPVWKEGVNVNPDRNTTTTPVRCVECGHEWEIKY